MRSRYDLMTASETQRDSDIGDFYPDPLTSRIQKFVFDEAPKEKRLTSVDTQRADIIVNQEYGIREFDDLLLSINRIPFILDVEKGSVIQVPTKQNMERFYSTYYR